MTTPARRERPMFAELVDWLEGEFPGLTPDAPVRRNASDASRGLHRGGAVRATG